MPTDIHVYDTFAPALGEAFGRAPADGRVLYGFVDHEVDHDLPRLDDRAAAAARAAHRPLRRAPASPLTWPERLGRGATRDFADVDALAVDGDAGTQRLGWGTRRVDLARRPLRHDPAAQRRRRPDDRRLLGGGRPGRARGQSVYSSQRGGTRIGERMTRPR